MVCTAYIVARKLQNHQGCVEVAERIEANHW